MKLSINQFIASVPLSLYHLFITFILVGVLEKFHPINNLLIFELY